MPPNSFEMPDANILDQMKGNPYPQAPKEIFPALKPTSGLGGGGGVGGAAARAREEARKREEEKEWANDFVGLGEHKPEPVEDPIEIKPKATLKKVGWVKAESLFKADSEVFAEFDIPDAIKNKKRVDFQLLHKQNGVFKVVATASGYNDPDGNITVALPLYKPSPETTEAIYCIKVNHCSGAEADWSKGTGTERTVTETAKPSFEHIKISGIHFSQNKSFIAPPYLKVMPKLVAEFRKWRETHEGAKILIYGHAEHDEYEPKKLSTRRAEAIFSFIHNDADAWFRISVLEGWGAWEHQTMLSAMGFYKGKADGQFGPKTSTAITGFQIFMNENQAARLEPSGYLTGDTRKAMYKQYMSGDRRDVDLPPIAFKDLYGTSCLGCSTYNRYKGDSGIHNENRRAGFVVVQESKNFPVYFPCRKDDATNCLDECTKAGERAIKGFGCKFYDEMVREEKVVGVDEVEVDSGSEVVPWLVFAENEAKRWKGLTEVEISKTINYHKEVGLEIGDLIGKSHAWCASFVNYCLKMAGFKTSSPPSRARSFLNDPNFVEIKDPIFGAIAVIGSYHVCFVYADDKNSTKPVVLGGNQSDQINFTVFHDTITYLLPKMFDLSTKKIPALLQKTATELNASIGINEINKIGDNTK